MNIEEDVVTRIRLSGSEVLDPVDVIFVNSSPGRGKIYIECRGKSWSSYWGAMGSLTVQEFFISCGSDYIIKNLSDICTTQYIPSGEKFVSALYKYIHEMSRAGVLSKASEKELLVAAQHFSESGFTTPIQEIMQKVFGDDWWTCVPTEPNPEYEYLKIVVETVQEGLREWLSKTVQFLEC